MKPGEMLITVDATQDLQALLKRFKNDQVLVGIPQEEASRDDDSGINNATLLAINNFGSPSNNIPAWPVLEIGLKNAQDAVSDEFKKAAVSALSKGTSALDVYYERAGIIASQSIKQVINSQEGAPPLSFTTIQRREAKGFKGNKRLIVTGSLRNSISYVVRGNG